jgi:hypothetical protein
MAGTLDTLALELTRVFEPLEARLAAGDVTTLFAELGLQFPDLSGETQLVTALGTAISSAQALGPLATTLATAISDGDDAAMLTATGQVLTTVGQLVTAIDGVATAIKSISAAGISPADIATFAAGFFDALIGEVLVSYLEDYHPAICAWLALLAVVELAPQNVGSVDPTHPPYTRRRILWDNIGTLFSKPQTLATTAYGWGTNTLDALTLFQRLQAVLHSVALPAAVEIPVTPPGALPTLRIFWLTIAPRPDLAPAGLEATLTVGFTDGFAFSVPIFSSPNWSLALSVTGALDASLGALLTPPATLALTPPTGSLTGDVSLDVVGKGADAAHPFVIFGSADGARVEANQVSLGAGAAFTWDAVANHATGGLSVNGGVTKGQVVIPASAVDGFLAALMPADGVTATFDLAFTWSADKGLQFSGGAGIETTIALNVTVGPVEIESLHVALGLAAAGSLSLEASVSANGTLGPITASIDRIGALAVLSFHRGNLGPLDLALTFKPPTGLGIAVDAGPISGGGYISFDPDNGRYAGVLSLSLYGIAITAIGLLDTKLPGGESGFSFLIIIAVQFDVGIQLGFGFTLSGVGGLCGINRTMLTDQIQSGLRHHTLDAILFPKDPVANAPQIISTLSTIYPPALGRYVFGPMLEIGWGTPTLVTAEIGVLIEVPAPIVIAILGQLAMTLPDPDAPIIEFHIDVLGVIDFGQQLFSIDATIHDSRIVLFTVSGDLAMRLNWGDSPSFLFSVGGFNPHYQPPPTFPTLQRLTVALDADIVQITFQAYLAVSSNSFQLGAHVEALLDADVFNVYGWLGFDALIIFSPFSFIVDFTAGLALRSGTSTIMGISVTGSLSGPTPWHVDGDASVSILFFDITVHVSCTIGSAQSNPLPVVNAWVPLLAAIEAVGNWSGALPPGAPQVATLVPPEGSAAPPLIDPAGSLTFRQKVLPLDQLITKFGEATPDQQGEFDIGAVVIGTAPTAYSTITDEFSPGQFAQLSDADKLSLPSFEPMIAGFTVSDTAIAFGKQYDVDIEFKTTIIDSVTVWRLVLPYGLLRGKAIAMAQWGAAARGALFTTGIHASDPPAGTPPLVTLDLEQYMIASVDTLAPRSDIATPTTKSATLAALNQHLAANPGDRGTLQIVPVYELAAA